MNHWSDYFTKNPYIKEFSSGHIVSYSPNHIGCYTTKPKLLITISLLNTTVAYFHMSSTSKSMQVYKIDKHEYRLIKNFMKKYHKKSKSEGSIKGLSAFYKTIDQMQFKLVN